MARLGVGIDLVGRGSELAELESALRRAWSGQPSGILLAGDAGVGKSRMVAETAERARGSQFTVLVGRCLDTADAALPYLPFTEIVASLAAARPEIVAERAALRSLLPGTVVRDDAAGDDRALGQLRVFDAVLSALDALSAVSPALLVVEDLHWADRSSRDLLVFLLSHLTAQRLVVLATYRRDDLHRRHPLRPVLSELVRLPAVERLELEPLGGEESLELVRRLADGSLEEPRLRRIARRSEGNAFFAEELVTADPAGVPEGLAEVLMARIEALPATAQRVLRIAAVSGRKVRHEVLAAVSDLSDDELEQALRDAVAHHVLVPDRETCDAAGPGTDGYVFRHALLREAIYQELLPGERTRLHARYAERLGEHAGEPGVAAELAHHAYAGHDLPRALSASIAAAREADTRDAPAEVLLQLERALELWHAVPEAETVAGIPESKITRWAGKYASFTGDPERAAHLGRRSVEVAEAQGDRIAAASNARNYAVLLLDLPGREQEALATAQKALSIVEGDPPSGEVAWAHATLARTLWRTDRAAEADHQARTAVAVVDAITEPDHVAIGAKADSLVTMSIYAQHLGDEERARRLIVEARELAHRSDHLTVELRSHYNLGMSLLEAGRLADAAAEFAEGEARADGVGLSWSGYGIDLRVTHVVTRYLAGDWDAAEAASRFAGRMVAATVGVRLAAAGMLVDTARGRLTAVEEQLAAVAEQQPFLDDQVIAMTGLAGAEAALWAGAPATTAARVDEAIAALQAMEPLHMAAIALSALGVAAQAALAEAGAVPAAQAVAEGARLAGIAEDTAANGNPRASTLGPEGLAWLSRARAELTRITGPDPEAWSRVVEAFAFEGGSPSAPGYRQAHALLRRAEARLAVGESPAAVATDLQAAHATALRLGAEPLAAAVTTTARRAGLRLSSGPAAVPATDPFTPRERAVLDLVAEGRTNRQVGAALFISEKTVSVHLSRVMAKLGASSRTEAVSVAYARGLAGKGPSVAG